MVKDCDQEVTLQTEGCSNFAFSFLTRYQSMQGLLHVMHRNYICLECSILSFPISSTFNLTLVSESRRAVEDRGRAHVAQRLCHNFVPSRTLISLTSLLSQISFLIHGRVLGSPAGAGGVVGYRHHSCSGTMWQNIFCAKITFET